MPSKARSSILAQVRGICNTSVSYQSLSTLLAGLDWRDWEAVQPKHLNMLVGVLKALKWLELNFPGLLIGDLMSLRVLEHLMRLLLVASLVRVHCI